MSDDQVQINAQRSLQEFDDAADRADTDPLALGRKAVEALDAFIAYWNSKSFMKAQTSDTAEGGDHALSQYGERQIEWARHEKERVVKLITKSGD
jgi:hypothetical protein